MFRTATAWLAAPILFVAIGGCAGVDSPPPEAAGQSSAAAPTLVDTHTPGAKPSLPAKPVEAPRTLASAPTDEQRCWPAPGAEVEGLTTHGVLEQILSRVAAPR